jgi:hypothetical protein
MMVKIGDSYVSAEELAIASGIALIPLTLFCAFLSSGSLFWTLVPAAIIAVSAFIWFSWRFCSWAVRRCVRKAKNDLFGLVSCMSFFAVPLAVAGVALWCHATGQAVSVDWFDWTLCFLLKLVLVLVFGSLNLFCLSLVLEGIESDRSFCECFCMPLGLLCAVYAAMFFVTSSLHFVKSEKTLAEEAQAQQMRDKYAELVQEEG